ncbi:MAG: diphosphate--fructose-6-phosphate 1-phosphotransferase [Hydrogenophilus sp.]|nr:diphosphate--fructose-6-phosphate 1-phosphotransferase [Hydrogenophilus sp.]
MTRVLYAQSGGMSPVINASAAGVIAAAQAAGVSLLAARFGIQGVLEDDLIEVPPLSASELHRLSYTPGGIFGTARRDLPEPEEDPTTYDRLFSVLRRRGITHFLYNGGNGSVYSVAQIAREAKRRGVELGVVAIPKTIDNDLVGTHFSPGYPSAARYLATSFLEASLDLASFPMKGARAFVIETMGRNTGWLAASLKVASRVLPDGGPHLFVLPEMNWRREQLLQLAEETIQHYSYCTVVVAEGARLEGSLLASQGVEGKRYVQLGGAGNVVGGWLREELGAKVHVAVPDYLQRAAAHWASVLDREMAWRAGETALQWALGGVSGVMVSIVYQPEQEEVWRLEPVPAGEVGNRERGFPREWIDEEAMQVRAPFLDYLIPLIEGCPVVPCGAHGLPDFLDGSRFR